MGLGVGMEVGSEGSTSRDAKLGSLEEGGRSVALLLLLLLLLLIMMMMTKMKMECGVAYAQTS